MDFRSSIPAALQVIVAVVSAAKGSHFAISSKTPPLLARSARDMAWIPVVRKAVEKESEPRTKQTHRSWCNYSIRALLHQALPLMLALTGPLMAWKCLCILASSPFPVICVISESMAPAFHRGDVLLLWNRTASVNVGDIPVIWFSGQPLPMVHRAIEVYYGDTSSDSGDHTRLVLNAAASSFFLWTQVRSYHRNCLHAYRQLIMTKGDNNAANDVSLYPKSRDYAYRHEVVGLVRGYVPWIGWLVIGLGQAYWLRYLVLGFALISAFDWW